MYGCYNTASHKEEERKKRKPCKKIVEGGRERDGSGWFDGERSIGNRGSLCTSDC